jgi:hypothetical protein
VAHASIIASRARAAADDRRGDRKPRLLDAEALGGIAGGRPLERGQIAAAAPV